MSLNNSDINNSIINKNINKNIDTSKIVYDFRNSLSNLLGTVKLNYNFYPGTQQNLNIIIKKIEELILSLYNIDNINEEKKPDEIINDGKDEEKSVKIKNNNIYIYLNFSLKNKISKKIC